MKIVTKVHEPSNAEHLEIIIRNFHESYGDFEILFETVVPIPGMNDLYRFIVAFRVNPTRKVVINDDTKGE